METQRTENNSFSKKDRLLKRSQFVRLSGSGKKRVNAHFILYYVPGKTDRKRLGITVSKKVGCAVVRNRVKRQCREYFRRNRHQIRGTWDISLIARKSVTGLSSDQAGQSLKSLLEKI